MNEDIYVIPFPCDEGKRDCGQEGAGGGRPHDAASNLLAVYEVHLYIGGHAVARLRCAEQVFAHEVAQRAPQFAACTLTWGGRRQQESYVWSKLQLLGDTMNQVGIRWWNGIVIPSTKATASMTELFPAPFGPGGTVTRLRFQNTPKSCSQTPERFVGAHRRAAVRGMLAIVQTGTERWSKTKS